MEAALHKHYMVILFELHTIDRDIEKLEMEKTIAGDRLQKMTVVKTQKEFDKKCILLKIKDFKQGSSAPCTPTRSLPIKYPSLVKLFPPLVSSEPSGLPSKYRITLITNFINAKKIKK